MADLPALTGVGPSSFAREGESEWDNPDAVTNDDIDRVLDERHESVAWEYTLDCWLCLAKDGRMVVVRMREHGTCEVCGGWTGAVRAFPAYDTEKAHAFYEEGA